MMKSGENRPISQKPEQLPVAVRPLTPKEVSAAMGGLRSARWVREQCALWLATDGREGIPTLTAHAPYLIPASVVRRYRPTFQEIGVLVAL